MAKKRLTQQEATEKLEEMQQAILTLKAQAETAKNWNGTLLKDALREADYAVGKALKYIKELPE